jgi:hypothetical protein
VIRWANLVWRTVPLVIAVSALLWLAFEARHRPSTDTASGNVTMQAAFVHARQAFRKDSLRYSARGTADVERPVLLNCTVVAIGESGQPVAADSFTLIGIHGAFRHSGTLQPTEFGKTVAAANGGRVATRGDLGARCETVGA